MQTVKARIESMRREVRLFYADASIEFSPYPFENNEAWRSVPLYKGGVRVERYANHFPTIMELVERHIPGATIREVIISCLEPNGRIAPHFDNTLPMLTLHVPLLVPAGEVAGIRVGSEVVIWREGSPVVIDTTYEHEAWNDGDSPRLNLLLDFWHPDLSADERRFFEECFRAQMEAHL